MVKQKGFENIGERLKSVRESANMTQDEVRERIGLKNKQTVLNYEKGYNPPAADFLIKYKEIFGVNLDWILTGEGDVYPRIQKSESIDDFLVKEYPHWKPIYFEMAKEILKEIKDPFILIRMNSYLIVSKKDKERLLLDKNDIQEASKIAVE